MAMVQPNKETIFTFDGITSSYVFSPYFFSMAGSPMKFAEMPTSEECEGV